MRQVETREIAPGLASPTPAARSSPWRARGARPLAVEGYFQAVAQGLGDAYLAAFAVWLSAGGVVVGLLGSLPTAAMAASQFLAARGRTPASDARSFIGGTWVLQAAALAALGGCALLPARQAIPLVCFLAFLAWALTGLSVPAWTSLVWGILPRSGHGRFFGLRGAVQQAGVLTALVGGGLLLSALHARGETGTGFLLLFLAAALFRGAGTAFLAAVPKSSSRSIEPAHAGMRQAFNGSGKLRRLSAYLWSLHFAMWVAAPFFVPYMLRDLQWSYSRIGAVIAVPAVVKLVSMRFWGRVADAVGPGPLLRVMGWLMLPVPGMWLVSGNVWWIVAAQIYAGIVWGALELAQASALLQCSRGRPNAIALFNAVDGVAMLGGSLVGGVLVLAGERLGISGYGAAIAVSTVLRAAPASLLLWRIRGIGRPRWSHVRMPLRLWNTQAARGTTFRPWAAPPGEEAPARPAPPVAPPR